MKVIYNKAIARANFEAHEKRQNRQERILGTTAGSCLICFIGLILTIIFAEYNPFYLDLCTAFLWGFAISVCLFISLSFYMAISSPAADVIYYQESQKRRVLDVKIKHEGHTTESVVMYSEGEDGIVVETELCRAVFQPSTKHNTETFDVHKGVIYTPYRASHNIDLAE